MSLDPAVLLAIAVMALVTYVARAGGYFLLGFVTIGDRLRRALEALPGAVIVSILAPMAIREPEAGATIAAAVILSMLVRLEWLAVLLAAGLGALVRLGLA